MRQRLACLLAFVFVACSQPCKISSDCFEGEHCVLGSGECVKGCTENAQCGSNRTCSLESGRCNPYTLPLPFADAGVIEDAGTSTAADAG